MVVSLTTSEWAKAISGSFAVPSNWSSAPGDTPGVPGSDSDVFLDAAGAAYTVTATVSVAPVVIDFLSLNANATLSIVGAGSFRIDSPVYPFSNAYNLGTINIGAGSSMAFGAAGSPSGDSSEIFNNGAVNIAGAGAKLQVLAPWFELNGSGHVTLSAGGTIVGATTSGGTLDNESNTIFGAGTIGNGLSISNGDGNGLSLQNDTNGTINANAATALILNTGENGISNSGTIETTGAGGLVIDSYMSQQGKLIAAGTGALVISNAEVQGGGTDSVAKGGAIQLNNGILDAGGTISIALGGAFKTTTGNTAAVGTNNNFTGDVLTDGNVENAGAITIANGSTLNFNASLYDNGGTMTLAGSTVATKLEIYGNGGSLYGTGQVILSNSLDNSIVSNGGGVQLSNFSTISGAGTIGDTWLRLYNATVGVVNANGTLGLTILGDSQAESAGTESADFNAGIIETTGAGGLTINGDFGNAGTIKAVGAGALHLNGGTLTNGGALKTTAAGASIILNNYTSVNNSVDIFKGSKLSTTAGDADVLANVFNNGTINVSNGSTLKAENNWDNTGIVDLNGVGTAQATAPTTVLEVEGQLELLGGGIVDLTNLTNASLNAINGDSGNTGPQYLENLNNTIEGAGVIGALNGTSNLNFTNDGIVDATGAKGAALTLDTGVQQIYNNGTIETTGAGGLTIDGVSDSSSNMAMGQDGVLIAGGAGALSLTTAYVQGSGSAKATIAGASIVLTNSTLNLQGTISTVAGSSIVAKAGADELDGGEIDNAGAITVSDGAILNLSGTINNTGTISLASVGDPTGLAIEGSGVLLAGTGSLILSGNVNNSIVGGASGYSAQFENTSNILGAGVIGGAGTGPGDQDLWFVNATGEIVNANGAAGLKIVGDSGGPTNSNAGLIETTGAGGLTITGVLTNGAAIDAIGTGALTLNGATVNDGGGVIQTTKAGAKIVLENGTVINSGTVSNIAGATLSTTAGDSGASADTLETAVNNAATAAINIATGSTLIASGNWANKGAINLDGAAGGSGIGTLEVSENLNLSGGGTVNLSTANVSDAIVSDAGNAFLTNVNNTIDGAGTIGDGDGTSSFSLTNAVTGTINATGTAGHALILNTGTNQISDAGILETTGAGGLTIESNVALGGKLIAAGAGALTIQSSTGAAQNNGIAVTGAGAVEATVANASVVLDNSTLNVFGTVSTVKSSSIVAAAGTTDELDAGNDIENAGAIDVDDGATLYLNAWINNGGGIINVGDTNGSATLAVDGWGAQIVGGNLVLTDGSSLISESGIGEENFYNRGSVSGTGTIGDADLAFQNLAGGVVDAAGTNVLTIDGDTATASFGADYNAGIVETTFGGTLTIIGATPASGTSNFTNAGLIDANTGTITFNGVVVGSGGGTLETTGTGQIVLENDSAIKTGLTMIGTGGSVMTTSGDIDTMDVSTFNAGTITVVDNSTLVVEAHWQNSNAVDIASTGAINIAVGDSWELLGDGTVNLQGTGASSIASAAGATSHGDTLDNVSNTIAGTGTIGDADMVIDNHAGATINATTGSLTIDATAGTSSNTYLYNSEIVEATAGGITIESQMQNFGQLIANGGQSIDAQFAVYGNGVARINGSGSSIEFGAEVDNDVIFGTGAQGTLVLDNSSNTASDPFNGSIAGFSHGDTLDLRDLQYNAGAMGEDPTKSSAGTLDAGIAFTNGATDSANIYFLGNYTNSTFQFASDGHGGTSIKI